MDGHGSGRKQCGHQFFRDDSKDRNGRGDGHPFFFPDLIDKKDRKKAQNMLQDLADGRNGGIFFSVVVSVNAGVDRAKGHRKCKKLKKLGTLFLPDKRNGEHMVKTKQQSGSNQGKGQREKKPGLEDPECPFLVSGCGFGGDKPGDRCLNAGYGQTVGECIERKYQLVDSHTLCTDDSGKEYSIEEADDPSDDPGQSEEKSSPQNDMFLQYRFTRKI